MSYCHRDIIIPWSDRTHFCASEVKQFAVTVVHSHIDRSVYTRFDGKLLCHTRCSCAIRLGIPRPLTDKTPMRCLVIRHRIDVNRVLTSVIKISDLTMKQAYKRRADHRICAI